MADKETLRESGRDFIEKSFEEHDMWKAERKKRVMELKRRLSVEEKEPFDFEKYIKIIFPDTNPKIFDQDIRDSDEASYYLDYPEVKTISDFAKKSVDLES